MRTKENGDLITLEQDLIDTFKLHGLRIVGEEVRGDTWKIHAVRMTKKEKENETKRDNKSKG
jgi:hypothetical protein